MPLPGPVIIDIYIYMYTQSPDDRISFEYPPGSAIDFVKPAFEGYGNGGGIGRGIAMLQRGSQEKK
jgi:hypothetical protein